MRTTSLLLCSALIATAAAPALSQDSQTPKRSDYPTKQLAAYQDYLRRSNEMARHILLSQAEFSPEQAARNGLNGYDEKVTVLSVDRPQKMLTAHQQSVAYLQDFIGKEQDPLVKQDAEIALHRVQQEIRGITLNEKYELPYYNVTGSIFGGLQSLLDDQVKPERRQAAVVRLRRYAGLEQGYRPMTVAAEEVITAKLSYPALQGPVRSQVEKDLATNALRLKGIAQLFDKYKIVGYQEPLAVLSKQLTDYDEFLRTKVLPRSRQDFRENPEIYQYSLEQYGIDIPAADLAAMAHQAQKNIQQQMTVVAAQVARERGLPSSDYHDVIRELKKDQIPNDEVLSHYHARLSQIEQIIRDKDLVSMPDRAARIRLGTDAENASSPAPHMVPPRLIGNTGEQGEFVLPLSNPATLGKGSGKMDDFTHKAASWTLTAHEARPGHELQFDNMVEHGVSIARANFAFNSVNAEGWGLYSEWMMYPYEPADGQLMALWAREQRAIRAYTDPELQMGKVTPEQALNLLETELVMSHGMASQEVERYTFRSPGQANSYFYGYLRLRELRADVERVMGKVFDQHKFHDFILQQGLLPPDMLRKAVFDGYVHKPDPGRSGLQGVLN